MEAQRPTMDVPSPQHTLGTSRSCPQLGARIDPESPYEALDKIINK